MITCCYLDFKCLLSSNSGNPVDVTIANLDKLAKPKTKTLVDDH